MPLQTKAIAGGSNARETTRPVSSRARELLNDQSAGRPVWVRPPRAGLEFYTGFSRAKLYEGAGKGHFRSVSIREPGQVKGTRLFNLASILAFIEKCEQGAADAAAKTTTEAAP
jgi:hypothetical protein